MREQIARMSVRSTVRRLALLVLLLAAPRAASALCTAQAITVVDPSCGASGPCTISGTYSIDNGCTLDFGARVVTLTGHLNIQSRSATIRAGTFTVAESGFIDAIGDAVGARGGTVVIETTGPFTSAASSRIDASGNSSGGDIIIRAGTTITISGRVKTDFLNAGAAGGLLDISAKGDIVLTPLSTVTARGGSDSDGGGEIDLTAGGNLSVQTELRVDAIDGGFVELRADGTVTMSGADASGGGDAGSGGLKIGALKAAQERMRGWLRTQGLHDGDITVVLGSGQSRAERGKPRALVDLLRNAWRSADSQTLVDSLPIAGVDGTLIHRMTSGAATGQAYLKTGTLSDTRALAGYVRAKSGRVYAVSMIVTDPAAAKGTPALDSLVEWVARAG